MKKLIIGALVGSVLMFLWMTASWTMLNLHAPEYQQAKDEAGVMSYLSSQFSEDGQYMIPTSAPDATTEEMEKIQADMKGKPWAVVSYHKSYDVNMTTNIIRGFLSTLIGAFLVCWLLMKQSNSTFMGTFLSCLFIGIAGYLFIPYSGFIWFQNPGATTHLIDTLVSWGLFGIWLGWWLNRK